jgi:hypothetical protein
LAVRVLAATGSAVAFSLVGLFTGSAFLAVQSFLRRDKAVLGKHTLEITEGGLLESTDVNSSLHKWGTAFRVRETSNYAYMYVSETNAHVIPRNRCTSGDSVEVFLAELRARSARLGAAPNGGPATPPENSRGLEGPPTVS